MLRPKQSPVCFYYPGLRLLFTFLEFAENKQVKVLFNNLSFVLNKIILSVVYNYIEDNTEGINS